MSVSKEFEAATDWLDANCEDAEASHDFVCRLRNALMGLDYEEGCPALDFIFPATLNYEEASFSRRIWEIRKRFLDNDLIEAGKLDDLVHTLFAADAAALNHNGPAAQITRIVKSLGKEQAVETLDRILEGS